MKIIICDDDPIYLAKLQEQTYIWKNERKRNEVQISAFRSSEDLLEQIETGLHADVFLLDILFESEINGLLLASEIRKKDVKVMIVFITNSEAYAQKGYAVQAFRYLSKPICFADLALCLDVAYRQYTLAHNEFLILAECGKRIVLRYDQITYIEAHSPYIEIHIFPDNIEKIRGTLAVLKNKLPEELFVQCHRSYIVNVLNIQSIRRNEIYLNEKTVIPVSRACFQQLCLTFDRYYQGGHQHNVDGF